MTSPMMAQARDCRRRSEILLNEANTTTNLNARSRLIGEAADWYQKALDAEGAYMPKA